MPRTKTHGTEFRSQSGQKKREAQNKAENKAHGRAIKKGYGIEGDTYTAEKANKYYKEVAKGREEGKKAAKAIKGRSKYAPTHKGVK